MKGGVAFCWAYVTKLLAKIGTLKVSRGCETFLKIQNYCTVIKWSKKCYISMKQCGKQQIIEEFKISALSKDV